MVFSYLDGTENTKVMLAHLRFSHLRQAESEGLMSQCGSCWDCRGSLLGMGTENAANRCMFWVTGLARALPWQGEGPQGGSGSFSIYFLLTGSGVCPSGSSARAHALFPSASPDSGHFLSLVQDLFILAFLRSSSVLPSLMPRRC